MTPAQSTPVDAPRWDLTWVADGLDDPAWAAAEESAGARMARLAHHFDQHDIREGTPLAPSADGAALLGETLRLLDEATGDVRSLRAVTHGMVTQNATDDVAASTQDRLRSDLTAPLNLLAGRLDAYCARLDLDALAELDPTVADHLHPLQRSVEAAAHQMGEREEALAARLGLTGGAAWVRLHGDICGRLTGAIPTDSASPLAGQVLPMTTLRSLATDPDRATRADAYGAELDAWRSVEVPLAACLNSQKGETIALNEERGWPDDLSPALFENSIDQATLDAMQTEVVASFPAFRRYLATKGQLLTGQDTIAWFDLIAPVGPSPDKIRWQGAIERVGDAFAGFSQPLARLVEQATNESWIDAAARPGKAGGAFCMPIGGEVSRIHLTFDGSADSIQTLAHELGHAYHNTQLGHRTWMQRATPRCLAETASIFCETLVTENLLASAAPADRLALLDVDLSGATQVVVDIHSRFLFETALYERRRKGTLSVDDLCSLMDECQLASYGPNVTDRHPYMWAVKPHYFTPFYNFPYTFGLLFGLGLYARFQADPDGFRANYDNLLGATGLATAADLAAGFGIDITDRAFWRASLDVIVRRIDSYCELAIDPPERQH